MSLLSDIVAPPVRPSPHGPDECRCLDPRPDTNGECQNRGCHRGVMADWAHETAAYQDQLTAWTNDLLDTAP